MAIINFEAGYPGINIKVELIVIREYLKQLDDGIKKICDTYESEELSKFEGAESHEYQHVFKISEDKLPRLIRLPFIITIYSLYENSVTQLLKYAQRKENKKLKLSDFKGRTLTAQFNKYLKYILEYEIEFSEKFRHEISNINKVRNCIAHANGNLDALDDQKRQEIDELAAEDIGISTDVFQLDVSSKYLLFSFELIVGELEALMDFIERKYNINN